MRQIKFRAWDKHEKEWLRNVNPQGNALNNYYLSFDGFVWTRKDINNESLEFDSYELSQFTGLLDKNGREIFEGDILSYPIEEQIISIRWDETRAGWQFDEHRGFDDGAGRGDWDFTLGIAKNSEIIGNIYENPELTK